MTKHQPSDTPTPQTPMRWRGKLRWPFAMRSTVERLSAQLDSARAQYQAEARAHFLTREEMRKMRDFFASNLAALTQLEPVIRWPVSAPMDLRAVNDETVRNVAMEIVEGRRRDVVFRVAIPAIFDFWMHRKDYSVIDDAIRYVAEIVGHQVARELRFGLTGRR